MNEEVNTNDKFKNETFIIFGTDTGISFYTSQGIKKLQPEKIYDKDLNEITEENK